MIYKHFEVFIQDPKRKLVVHLLVIIFEDMQNITELCKL